VSGRKKKRGKSPRGRETETGERDAPPPLNLMAAWRAICLRMSWAWVAAWRSSVACNGHGRERARTRPMTNQPLVTGRPSLLLPPRQDSSPGRTLLKLAT